MSGEREYHPRGFWGPNGDLGSGLQLSHGRMPVQSAFRMSESDNRILELLNREMERKSDLTEQQKAYLRHWAFAFLEYCRRTNRTPQDDQSRMDFLERMGQKGRSPFVIKEAEKAIKFLRRTIWRTPHPAVVFTEEGCGQKEMRDGQMGIGVWKQVLEKMEREVRIRHYSSKTLKTYVHWIRGFAQFLAFRNPSGLTAVEAKAFLEFLAIERGIAASTQNQAFNALLFLFNHVLDLELEGLSDTPRAKRSGYVPEVFSKEEVERIFRLLEYPYDVFAQLLYGCGLRLGEGLNIRTVKDWMGHEDVKTTQIYTQALQTLRDGPSNPLDWL